MENSKNYMEMKFKAISVNEAFARVCVASFCLSLNPSIDELTDIKTAVSEAVTNCVVHAYPISVGEIYLRCEIVKNEVIVEVADSGVGIADFSKAREPFYTTKPTEERSGMGFAVMESFMDSVDLEKNGIAGLKVTMRKKIAVRNAMVAGDEC